MTDEILYKILMVLVILAVATLIVILWRVYFVLTDINDTTKIVKKRVLELDLWMTRFADTLNSVTDVVEGIMLTLSQFGKIKDRVRSFVSNLDGGSKEKDKEENE